jgi:hypothetical protein
VSLSIQIQWNLSKMNTLVLDLKFSMKCKWSSFYFWSLYCLSFFDLRHFITFLISSNFNHCIVCLSHYSFWLPLSYLLITPFIPSDYSFHTFWLPLSYLLITPFIPSDYPFHTFWLPLSYLQTFLLCRLDRFNWSRCRTLWLRKSVEILFHTMLFWNNLYQVLSQNIGKPNV